MPKRSSKKKGKKGGGGKKGKEAKEAGTVRSEGKEYEVKDADVMLFRFNN